MLAFDGYVRPHFHILMTGDGIDRDELEKLWNKCDRPNTRRISPDDDFLITGLGEYISKKSTRYKEVGELKKLKEATGADKELQKV